MLAAFSFAITEPMPMHYSKREVATQLEALLRQRDALYLGDWDRKFLDDLAAKPETELTEKQRVQVTRIYMEKLG